MVEREPGSYRPRRVFVEPEAVVTPPAESPVPTPPDPAASPVAPSPVAPYEETVRGLFRDETPAPTPPAPAGGLTYRPISDNTFSLPRVDAGPSEPPAPIPTSSTPLLPTPTGPTATTGPERLEETVARPAPINLTPRRTRSDAEATTVLPRTAGSSRRAMAEDLDDDSDDRGGLGPRTKMALLIAGVAAIVVAGLFVVYSVSGFGKSQTPVALPTPSVGASTPGSTPTPSDSAATPPTNQTMLSAQSVIDERGAALLAKRTWKVATTETSNFTAAAQPACYGGTAPEGQPAAAERVLRVLTSSGRNAPGALHDATAYATPEEAQQAFTATLKTLGSCAATGSYIVEGRTVTGLGDQAAGEVVAVVNGKKTTLHTLVVNRTGRVVNVLDASQPDKPLSTKSAVLALAATTTTQCAAAGGKCPDAKPDDAAGPPPAGGDEPGFLATGDLPPGGTEPLTWAATRSEAPSKTFAGSQCEVVNWSTLASTSTLSRVYLLQNSGTSFGLNEIVVTLKNEKAATDLMEKVKSNLSGCEGRLPTAKVSKLAPIKGVGARKTPVTGYTAAVAQASTKSPVNYRVGVVAAGKKVAYTFLNPQPKQDFTPEQWNTVALRAGERATQAK